MSTAEKQDVSKWPRVTAILAATGVADFSKIPNSEFYMQRGSDVHLAAESIDKGEPFWWEGSEIEGYAKAWIQFRDDTSFRSKLIEHPVFNEVRRYRGTLDRVGHFGDQKARVLIDIKAGIAAAWVPLQTAGYAACLPEPESIHRYGLQLKKDGTYNLSAEYKNYREDSNAFFSLVSCVHLRGLYGAVSLLEGE